MHFECLLIWMTPKQFGCRQHLRYAEMPLYWWNRMLFLLTIASVILFTVARVIRCSFRFRLRLWHSFSCWFSGGFKHLSSGLMGVSSGILLAASGFKWFPVFGTGFQRFICLLSGLMLVSRRFRWFSVISVVFSGFRWFPFGFRQFLLVSVWFPIGAGWSLVISSSF